MGSLISAFVMRFLESTISKLATSTNFNIPGFYTNLNVWGSLGLTLIMMGVPSLKMGVPSFYIRVEFWNVVHPSVKGFEQALAVRQVSQNIKTFSHLNHLYRPKD